MTLIAMEEKQEQDAIKGRFYYDHIDRDNHRRKATPGGTQPPTVSWHEQARHKCGGLLFGVRLIWEDADGGPGLLPQNRHMTACLLIGLAQNGQSMFCDGEVVVGVVARLAGGKSNIRTRAKMPGTVPPHTQPTTFRSLLEAKIPQKMELEMNHRTANRNSFMDSLFRLLLRHARSLCQWTPRQQRRTRTARCQSRPSDSAGSNGRAPFDNS